MTLDQPLLRLQGVGKQYRLRESRFVNAAARALMSSWLTERRREFWALRNMDIELRPGRMLGVIGLNGSGKSTLLKLMAGVTAPSEGEIERRGEVAGLLELGAGFHPELTGYQNIFLQCSLMGLRKREARERLPRIVEFSGLGEALEWPVKRYSSGMYARLGFSVALHIEASIILIDEILSVGDASFQRRGLSRIQQIHERGDAILVLVTHDIHLAREYCDELIWLDKGEIQSRGEPESVFRDFVQGLSPEMARLSGHRTGKTLYERALQSIPENSPARIESARFLNADEQIVESIRSNGTLILEIDATCESAVRDATLWVALSQQKSLIPTEFEAVDFQTRVDLEPGRNTIRMRFDPIMVRDGETRVTAILSEDPEGERCLAAVRRLGYVKVETDSPDYFVVQHPHEWDLSGAG